MPESPTSTELALSSFFSAEISAAVDTSYITGIANVGERMLILTDIEALMSSEEMGLLDSAAA